jgi:hypothetical protein
MSERLFRDDGSFWFTHAVVARGYHGWGIAPEEVLSDDRVGFQAMKLTINIASDCKGSRDLRSDAPKTAFVRIADRGRYLAAEQRFEVDCVCAVEATTYTESKAGFWQFL